MKLLLRTALVPLSTVTILSLGLYLIFNQQTVKTFNKLEESVLIRNVERVENGIKAIVDQHAIKLVDWAHWDDSYQFMKSQAPSYIQENLNPLTMSALGYTSLLYFSSSGDFYYGTSISTRGDSKVEVPSEQIELIKQLLTTNQNSQARGLIEISGRGYLFASSPILPNSGTGSSRGTLVAITLLSEQIFSDLSYRVNLNTTFSLVKNSLSNKLIVDKLKRSKNNVELAFPSKNLSYGYGLLRDISGNPLYLFSVTSNREVLLFAKKFQAISVLILGISGIVATFFLIFVIYIAAIKHINLLSEHAKQIAVKGIFANKFLNISSTGISLKIKTFSCIALVFAGTIIFTGTTLTRLFLKQFEEIEQKEAKEDLERGYRALQARLNELLRKTVDWAQWDETYSFVLTGDAKYKTSNCGFDTFEKMGISHVLLFNREVSLIDGYKTDKDKKVLHPVNTRTVERFKSVPLSAKNSKEISGFINLPDTVVLVGASQVLNSKRLGEPRGWLLFAKSIDEQFEQELSKQTNLSLNFDRMVGDNLVNTRSILPITESTIKATLPIKDPRGNTAFRLSIILPRSIYEQGRLAAKILPLYIFIGGIVCIATTLIGVSRLMLVRIDNIGKQSKNITLTGNLHQKIFSSGRDEIASLATNINSMLAALQRAQEDISKAKDAADVANKAKSMFIAKISHELRTPLSGIIGIHNIILGHSEISKSVRELLQMANLASESLLESVNEILDYSKAEAGELTFNYVRFDLRKMIRDTMKIISSRLDTKLTTSEDKKIDLVVDIHPTVPLYCIGDPIRIRQVLINLLGNSIKFTERGVVKLTLSVVGKCKNTIKLCMTVEDTGLGIPENKLETIFAPYKQVEDSQVQYQGTGLGLSIVKEFIEGMGGTISAISTIDKGSKFTIFLPLDIDESKQSDIVPRLNNDGRENFWPSRTLFIGSKNISNETLVSGLNRFGLFTELIPLEDSAQLLLGLTTVNTDCLIVLSEEALELPSVISTADSFARHGRVKVIGIVTPSRISLRESLEPYSLSGYVTVPALAEEIIWAAQGVKESYTSEIELGSNSQLAFSRTLKILIADDTITTRFILKNMLEEAGHIVTEVSDGKELIELISPQLSGREKFDPFDLIITDISMTHMNGDVASLYIRSLEKQVSASRRIPIIAATAQALADRHDLIYRSGVDLVLVKPIKPSAIAEAFSKLL
jgi:signal transduction histidine kinase/CheY-like chemotaxis protein